MGGLAVVGLCLAVSSSVGPVTGVALRGGSDLGAGAGPEPAVDIGGLQVGSVAARKIALATRRPDVAHVTAGDPLLDELVLLHEHFQRLNHDNNTQLTYHIHTL